MKTAQSVDATRTADAPPADAATTVQPSEIGLRGSGESQRRPTGRRSRGEAGCAQIRSTPRQVRYAKARNASRRCGERRTTGTGRAENRTGRRDGYRARHRQLRAAQTAAPATADVTPSATAAPDVPAPLSRLAEQVRDAVAKKNADCDLCQPQGEEDLRAAEFRAAVRRRRSPSSIRNSRSGRTSSPRWNYLGDDRTTLRWTVVSLPGEPPESPCARPRTTAATTGIRAARAQGRGRREARGRAAAADPAAGSRAHRYSAGDDRLYFPTDGSRLVAGRVRPGSRRGNR